MHVKIILSCVAVIACLKQANCVHQGLLIKRNFFCNKRKNHNVWNKFLLGQVSFDTKEKKI